MKEKQLLSLTALLLVALLSLQLAGCAALAPSAEAANLMENVTPNRGEATPVRQEDAAAATDFALRLFRAGNDAGKNTLIAPVAVLSALAMTANGAGGETLAQMEQTLGMDRDRLNAFVYSYLEDHSKDGAMNVANSIWFKNDFGFKPDQSFLQTNADYFGADLYQAPFNGESVDKINQWVKEKTDGKIPQIVERLPDTTVICLVNALSFEAKWEEPYETSDVSSGPFFLENGETCTVRFMESTEYDYLEDEKAVGFLKPYKGGKYAFVALLPKEAGNLTEYVNSLQGAELQKMISERSRESVITRLPKFQTSYDADLCDTMRAMGLELPFDGSRADFSGMGSWQSGNLSFEQMIHKSFISVGEQGTRAGAALLMSATLGAVFALPEYKKVDLDHPFVYMLIDTETNLPFFIGTMLDPGK